KKFLFALLVSVIFTMLQSSYAANANYGQRLCNSGADVHCITIKKGDSWSSLFPDPTQQDMVKRLNRMNTRLYKGMKIAVPNDMDNTTFLELAPFDANIGYQDHKTIIVDPYHLAWGAYDQSGQLISWGPASTGKSYCPDVNRGCKTPQGIYTIFRKEGEECF